MPRKGGISNRKLKKTRASNELNPWLLKRVTDRALPFTARSAIRVSMPSLLSHIWQQPHLGESNSRLARWVLAHAGLAFTMPRVTHLPLVSGASDFARRKSAFVPPVWQRMLNLPWFRPPWEQEHGTGPTAYVAEESNSPDTARLLQTAPNDKAGQLVREADEAHPWATKESLPLMTTPRFSPPVISRERRGTAHEPPQPNVIATIPIIAKQVSGRLYLSGLTKVAPVMEEEPPVPVFGQRLPDITSEQPDHARTGSRPIRSKQIAVGQPTEDANGSTLSNVSRSTMPNSGIGQSSEVAKPDRRHIQVAQEILPRNLTLLTQRMTPQHRPMVARPPLIGPSRASQTGYADYPKAILTGAESGRVTGRQAVMPFTASTVKASPLDETPAPTEHTLISSTQPAILERETLPDARPGPSKPPMTDAGPEGLGRPAVPRAANKPDGLVPNSRPPQGVLPFGVAASTPLETGQARVKEPVIRRPVAPAGQKAEVTWAPEDLSNLTTSPDTLSFVTGIHSGMDRGFPEEHTEEPLPYSRPPSITDLAIRPPMIGSISRTMAFPTQPLFKSVAGLPLSNKSEDHRFRQSREYVPSSPGYKYARQPALELPVASPARLKTDFSATRSEELFRHMSDTKPEPAYSRNHNGSELSLAAAPVGQVLRAKEPPQPTAPEPRGEKRGEKETTPDLRALAREIYPLIKRMLMVERERRPT
jgi:hypothetical protein